MSSSYRQEGCGRNVCQSFASASAEAPKVIKGVPALLVPVTEDWSPTVQDVAAPKILPKRSLRARLETMWLSSAGKPLKEAPHSFRRPVPGPGELGCNGGTDDRIQKATPYYRPFAAFYLPGKNKKYLSEGFEARYPASIMTDHNVSALDWDRFLRDICTAGALPFREHLVANLIPTPLILVHAGLANYFITRAIMGRYKRRHVPLIISLVEVYQVRFFQPRRLDVFVVRGTQRLSGHFPGDYSFLEESQYELGVPADLPSDSSPFSSADKGNFKHLPTSERRAAKQERQRHYAAAKRTALMKQGEMMAQRPAMIARRRIAVQEERMQGFTIKKHGKYRIIVQPQMRRPPQPTQEDYRKIVELEKFLGRV